MLIVAVAVVTVYTSRNESTLLTHMPMVMAHDAGSGYLEPGLVNSWARTQSGGFTAQLDCGARAFDARPYLSKRRGLVWHHGGVTVPQALEQSLTEVIAWLATHPSELVIWLIWDCKGEGCMAAVAQTMTAYNVTNVIDCGRLQAEQWTYGEAKRRGRLPAGGSLVVFMGPEACSEPNYYPNTTCTGFLRALAPARDIDAKSRVASAGSGEHFYSCWQTDRSRDTPLQRMLDSLDVAARTVTDAHFSQAQALWQESADSVAIGVFRGSSLLIDEQRSGLNRLVADEVLRGRWARLNLVEVNHVCDGGSQLLAALLQQLS